MTSAAWMDAIDGDAASDKLSASVSSGVDSLLRWQQPDGHFVFDLEADAAIPAEYVIIKHFLGEIDPAADRRAANYLRRRQETHGGWPKLIAGKPDVSASVKSYFALKLAGDPVDAPHMVRARAAIRAAGGAVNVNVFTRLTLALFGIVPWRAVPVMPVELMHAPGWFPFHLFKISFWARDTLVPLMVIMAYKPRAANPRAVTLDELFLEPPHAVATWPKTVNQVGTWGMVFAGLDRVLRVVEPLFPRRTRRSAIDKAVKFARERLNGEDGFGAIFPSIAYTVMMFKVLGLPEDHPEMVMARAAFEKLVAFNDDEQFCQPCLSPVWDTALAVHALLETTEGEHRPAAERGLEWLKPLQILEFAGDWAYQKPDLRPGGWAFMYNNPHYPDVDDTAVVAMAMDRLRRETGTQEYDGSIARAREWIVGMQSRNGGWGAYDADNTSSYLNHIPFADHGALLDPPTSDVTARCLAMLGQLGDRPETSEPVRRGLEFLLAEQHVDGSWFGRWGVNYIYGTWSVLCALAAVGIDAGHPAVRRAASWLVDTQNPDGGWGEDDRGYELDYKAFEPAPSVPSQTAWALLGLMAAGEVDSVAVQRGVAFLQAAQAADGDWWEDVHTAVGFPRVFYLRYDGYRRFFPLQALARYRNLRSGLAAVPPLGF